MSGTPGMNDWEGFWRPTRDSFASKQAERRIRSLSNNKLAKQLERIAEVEPHFRLVIREAVSRLHPGSELITMEEIKRN